MASADGGYIPYGRLPEGFVDRLRDPFRPARPRPAATVALLRLREGFGERLPDAEGPNLRGDAESFPDDVEILLVRRSRSAGFVPGAYVFPGGRVDPADASPRLLARVRSGDVAHVEERLAPSRGVERPMAYWLAAVRETFEETGILLAENDSGPMPTAAENDELDAIRRELMARKLTMAEALERLDARIGLSRVVYLARWVTPEAEPRRYDTRFFAAWVSAGTKAVIDTREMTDAVWLSPGEALRRQADGELPMVFPTVHTLESLAAGRSVKTRLAAMAAGPAPTFLPKLTLERDGVRMEL